jgi:transposase-like protein
MVTISIPCPHCQQAEPVVKNGLTEAGSQRFKCNACNKTFTPAPVDRSVTEEKEALILAHLQERTSIRGICRVLKCSPNTIYATLKKDRGNAGL